jgi:hypothetical protein
MATSSDYEPVHATVEVLALDMYGTLVDPIRITTALDQVAPGDSDRLAALWRSTQLEYTFRLAAMGAYEDFELVTRKALDHAPRQPVRRPVRHAPPTSTWCRRVAGRARPRPDGAASHVTHCDSRQTSRASERHAAQPHHVARRA